MDTSAIIVFILGVSIGSGAALKRAGPYLFYYVSVPLLSAIGLTWVMKDVHIPGFDFQFDRMLPMVVHNQTALILMAAKGVLTGLILHWIYKGLFVKKDRRKAQKIRRVDGKTPMKRRKYLAILGLPKSAGPRDITLAWSKLSRQVQDNKWPGHPLRRKQDMSPQEFKQQIDEAYAWLSANRQKDCTVKTVSLSSDPS